MRVLRSILCAGLGMIAVALCASMPAVAAVPIDVSVAVQSSSAKDYPAPALHAVSQDVAVLPSEAPTVASFADVRSSLGNDSPSFADTSIAATAYRHIDPDIAG